MSAYVIVQIEVSDPEAYEVYRTRVPPTLELFGGEYLVRGGAMEILEGQWPHPRCVVLKFPSMDQAKAWYASADYEEAKSLRQASSDANMIVVEGVNSGT